MDLNIYIKKICSVVQVKKPKKKNLIRYIFVCSLLQLQWKQDLEMGLELISKAIEIDNKCDFAYETMGTIEVQRFVKAYATIIPSNNIFL